MAKNVLPVSEAKAASGFGSLMARAREGTEMIVENGAKPVAVLHRAEPTVRRLSESLQLAREHASTATLEEDFANKVEAAIASYAEALNPPQWD
jgi:hypothetical protein